MGGNVIVASHFSNPISMKKLFFLYFFCGLFFSSTAQKHDYVWLFGAGNQPPPKSDSRLDFNFDPPQITIDPRPMFLVESVISVSDSNGFFKFYSNGKSVANFEHLNMHNGYGLIPGDHASNTGSSYVNAPQGIMAIPAPGESHKYFMVHAPYKLFDDPFEFITFGLLYSIVDMSENDGLGKVISKNVEIISDSLWLGKLTATKHANGRDWWILYNEWLTNNYYTVLVTPDGISVVDTQTVGTPVNDGLAQAVFSPDGSKFAVVNGVQDSYIQLFDFDRCTGLLSNEIFMIYPRPIHNIVSPGLAISPNSRFLYFSATDTIYQYDLWAGDIPASETVVGEYDWNVDPFPNLFYLAQLAPDGKIYFSVPNGTQYLHTIEYPNKKGAACNFIQRNINLLNYNAYGLPNNPYYRLGPLDGSPCDTLGLDNIPVAKYRYAQPDSMDYLTVEFADLSYYEPVEWFWDFGDNATSQDTSPVHTFTQQGIYEVCLTVSNQYGEDTFCRILQLGTVGTGEEEQEIGITVFPNPCREGVNVIISDYLPKDAKVVLYDAIGQRHKVQSLQTGWNNLRLDGLQAGLYFYEIWEGSVLLRSGKLVKVE